MNNSNNLSNNPNNKKDWFNKHNTEVDPVLFNIYNGCWIKEDTRIQGNTKILNRNLVNVYEHPCQNKIDIENKLKNISNKCNRFRLVKKQ